MSDVLDAGSRWHRWDPHIHTPGTLLNDGYEGRWNDFFTSIETATPTVEALGITDYCSLEGYLEFCSRRNAGKRAQNLKLVFPNIEFRLTIETEKRKGINLHLLFSPDDKEHTREITRILSQLKFRYKEREYACTSDDLRLLGRAYNPKQTDDRGALVEGASQFKLDYNQLRKLFADDKWMRENCLVALCANTSDGSAGLKGDNTFKATRQELERFCNLIFSSQDGDRSFWLGQKDGHDEAHIEEMYGNRKPCIHGSDAHRLDSVLRPDGNKYCWIRSDVSFTGLKQILIEPAERVHIGPIPPVGSSPRETICEIEFSGASWLDAKRVLLNDGLVTIIGPKGSGKTALADMIAHTAGANIEDDASFLTKAKDYLGDSSARLKWGDGEVSPNVSFSDNRSFDTPSVRYLSQKFVDKLCTSHELSDELLREIESVVFRAVPEEDRLGATSFDELKSEKLESVERLRAAFLEEIDSFSIKISAEDKKMIGLPKAKEALEQLEGQLKGLNVELATLVPKDKTAEAKTLQDLEAEVQHRLDLVQNRRRQLEKLVALSEEYANFQRSITYQFNDLKENYDESGLLPEEWTLLAPVAPAEISPILGNAKTRIESEISRIQTPSAAKNLADLKTWPLSELRLQAATVKSSIGLEQERIRKHQTVQSRITETRQKISSQTAIVRDFSGAESRRKDATAGRRQSYSKVFDTFATEEATLTELYGPLSREISSHDGAENNLSFYVRRNVDCNAWVEIGESLLDLRSAGSFHGRGSLLAHCQKELLPAWSTGGAEAVSAAMDSFINEHFKSIAQQKRKDVSFEQLAAWIFGTSHVTLEYGIRYGGVDIGRLSPGTRGIVLLMLYLAIDKWDFRPLLVDQPEDNLDPQSVYEQLVPYFRAAKKRRQVILVTHNPNLVVNADADQVIVAESHRAAPHGLPQIKYTSGGLENHSIRDLVCKILEGGERAFLDRESRYNLR